MICSLLAVDLAFEADVRKRKFMRQASFISRFEKPRPEQFMNLDRRTDNFLRQAVNDYALCALCVSAVIQFIFGIYPHIGNQTGSTKI